MLDWGEIEKTISALLLEKEKLVSAIIGMEEEVTMLNSKLENLSWSESMMNNHLDMGDVIIGNMKVVRFDYSSMNKKVRTPFKKSGHPKKKTEFLMMNYIS